MTEFFLALGRSVIKSMLMSCQTFEGIGSGINKPAILLFVDLTCGHTKHSFTYLFICAPMFGQKNIWQSFSKFYEFQSALLVVNHEAEIEFSLLKENPQIDNTCS